MKRYKYRFQTISCLALSPRDHQGFYKDAGDFETKDIRISNHRDKLGNLENKINIIYPFYQYGTYPKYDPKHTQYYIPGSSIKGAILAKDSTEADEQLGIKLMVDDVSVKSEDLRLHLLYKVQNLAPESEHAIELGDFFPNVAVEMLTRNCEYTGEMFGNGEYIRRRLSCSQQATKEKLGQFIELLDNAGMNGRRKVKESSYVKLQNMQNGVKQILKEMEGNKDSFILLMGGFKGLSLSRQLSSIDGVKSAIYVDHVEGSYLPHGLVRIILE
ncbi:hypothetical protein [Paenibacillus sp. FSL K6-2441]|uniref:hypothetical protein n=1 Tax=Paenibacillus TaxID=44249 RepID=UPI0030D9B27D